MYSQTQMKYTSEEAEYNSSSTPTGITSTAKLFSHHLMIRQLESPPTSATTLKESIRSQACHSRNYDLESSRMSADSHDITSDDNSTVVVRVSSLTGRPKSHQAPSHPHVSAPPPPSSSISPPIPDEVGGHTCAICGARCARLDHLRRHIASRHDNLGVKPHACQSCGKRFSRSDVLSRHRQFCQGIEPSIPDSAVNQLEKPFGRSCQSCILLAIACNGHSTCKDCQQANRSCIYDAPSSPTPDRSLTTGSPRLLSTDGPRTNREALPQSQDNDQGQEQSSVGWEDFAITQQTSGAPPLSMAQAEDSDVMVDEATSKGIRLKNRRGRYISNACANCQKRKVKCSGGEICQQCRSIGEVCLYSHGRKRKLTAHAMVDRQNRKGSKSSTSDHPAGIPASLLDMMNRIANLEKECQSYRVQTTVDGNIPIARIKSTSHPLSYSSEPSLSSTITLSRAHSYGKSSLYEPIKVLNRAVVDGMCGDADAEADPEADLTRSSAADGHKTTMTWHSMQRAQTKDAAALVDETRRMRLDRLQQSFKVFFAHLNPHYPCINENQFLSQVEKFLANDTSTISPADHYQIAALINLIDAEVRILADDCSDSRRVPAWDQFCRAETLLTHITWLGDGNLLTVQCLIVKAKYLLYAERGDSAFDTIGQAVRSAFKLGLHHQASWTNLSPFETVMRQRIFWTLVYFERSVAFNCGFPYSIRESDFLVDLSRDYDDKQIFPDQPLPTECFERSYAPYLRAAVKWSQLCAEIWDTICGIKAPKPTSQEFIASMDARLCFMAGQLPPHLQLLVNGTQQHFGIDAPLFIARQGIILRLRVNQLRLFLSQESMLTLKYDDGTAHRCMFIAIDSIDLIQNFYNSDIRRSTDRFSSVLYLLGALLNLVCIIVKADNSQQSHELAIAAWHRGLSMLYELAPSFSMARHVLRRINRIIKTAERAISRSERAASSTCSPGDIDMATANPYVVDFFDHHCSIMPGCDSLSDQLDFSLDYNLNSLRSGGLLTDSWERMLSGGTVPG